MGLMKFAKIATALLTLSLALPLAAKDKKKDHDHGHGKQENSPTQHVETSVKGSKAVISIKEKEVIQTYVQNFNEEGKGGKKHKGGLPPGLQKKLDRGGQLPPGWQKKVCVGETMPPEVFKECKPLPKELTVKLPPPPLGTLTVSVDGKIVRLMEATKQILDVFELPLPPLSRR